MISAVTVLAVLLFNAFGIIVFAVTGFGNAVVFDILWQICYSFDPEVCSGSNLEAVVFLTMANLLTTPVQSWILREHINWPLFLHVTFASNIGLFAGLYLLFAVTSPWISRILGLVFYFVSVDKMIAEVKFDYAEKTSLGPSASYDVLSDDVNVMVISVADDEAASSPKEPVYSPVEPMIILSGDAKWDSLSPHYDIDNFKNYLFVWACSLFSGLMAGLFAVGSPPMIFFVAYSKIEKNECRATISCTIVLQNFIRLYALIAYQTQYNMFTAQNFMMLILISVSSLVVLKFGNWLAKFCNEKVFRQALLGLLVTGSAIMMSTDYSIAVKVSLIIFGVASLGVVGYVYKRLYLNK